MALTTKRLETRYAAALLTAAVIAASGLALRLAWPDPAPHPAIPSPPPPAPHSPVIPASAPAPAPSDGFTVKRILDIPGPLDHGDWAWDDKDVPAGPIVITIDLEAQTLSVFRGGYEIGAAVILYGAGDKPTPLGSFAVTEKDVDHVSNLYDAPMPYMLRLTNDGITIHGSDVEWGAATHGCIGVPTRFARLLFDQVRLGDPVIVTSGKMMDVGQLQPTA